MSTQWYYARNNQQSGPVSTEELQEMLKSGKLRLTDLVWNEKMSDWMPAGKLKGLLPPSLLPKLPPPLPPPSKRPIQQVEPIDDPSPTTRSHKAEIAEIRRAIESIKVSKRQTTVGRSLTFGEWYEEKFGNTPLILQIALWVFYGFLWIPIYYGTTAATGKGKFGRWYSRRFSWIHALPGLFSFAIQAAMWTFYGFVWIPLLYLMTSSEGDVREEVDPRITELEDRIRALDPTMPAPKHGVAISSFPAWTLWCYFPYFNFISWLYVGVRCWRGLYLLFAALYLAPWVGMSVMINSAEGSGGSSPSWLTGTALLSWIFGIFHANSASREIGVRLRIMRERGESPEEMERRIRAEMARDEPRVRETVLVEGVEVETVPKRGGMPGWLKKALFAVPGFSVAYFFDKIVDYFVNLLTG